MMVAKLNAKCAVEVLHPALPFLIHKNREENNRGMGGGSLGPLLCAKSGLILHYFELKMIK